MSTRKFPHFFGAVGAAFLAFMVAGCAAIAPSTPEQLVKDRAQERWNDLVAAKWDKVYSFVSPAFRAAMPEDRYRERFVGVPKWSKAEVIGVKCEPAKCVATVRIHALYGASGGLQTLATDVPETWLLEDGQWYKYEAF